jgi:curved DNA-binding protein CbpA
MMAWKDPYAILGVGRGAPLSEIKRAYRKLAFRTHPDVVENPDAQRFREVREAYAALNEKQQRRARRIKVLRAPDRYGYAGMPCMEPRRGPEPLWRRELLTNCFAKNWTRSFMASSVEGVGAVIAVGSPTASTSGSSCN